MMHLSFFKLTKPFYLLLLLFLSLLFNTISYAGMRCGTTLIDVGASRLDVKDKCGKPDQQDSFTETQTFNTPLGGVAGSTTIQIDIWVYQKSSNTFRYELRFENSKLKNIKTSRT